DLLSFASYANRLDADPGVLSPVTGLFRDALSALDATQRLVLQVFVVCGPAEVPAAFVRRVVAALSPDEADLVGTALVGLGDRLLASRNDTAWKVHTLVRDTAREHLKP